MRHSGDYCCEISCFLKTTAKKLGDQYIVGPQPKIWGSVSPGTYGCCELFRQFIKHLFTWWTLSLKLATDICHVSMHCRKGSEELRSKVKLMTYIRGGIHFSGGTHLSVFQCFGRNVFFRYLSKHLRILYITYSRHRLGGSPTAKRRKIADFDPLTNFDETLRG